MHRSGFPRPGGRRVSDYCTSGIFIGVPAFPPFQLVIEVIRATFHVGGLLTIF